MIFEVEILLRNGRYIYDEVDSENPPRSNLLLLKHNIDRKDVAWLIFRPITIRGKDGNKSKGTN